MKKEVFDKLCKIEQGHWISKVPADSPDFADQTYQCALLGAEITFVHSSLQKHCVNSPLYWVISHWSYSSLDVLSPPEGWEYKSRTVTEPAPWIFDLYVGCSSWNQTLHTYPHPITGNPVRILSAGSDKAGLLEEIKTYSLKPTKLPINCFKGKLVYGN